MLNPLATTRALAFLFVPSLVAVSCSKKPTNEAAPSASIAAAVPAKETGPMKVAFAYVGPVGDAGWTFAHDKARKQAEAALAGKVKTSFVENVP
ncbi:MAG TPA: hypothetical protein VFQ35_04730, partial [Polyangiaceae bacterium]|nr:hypothetical protein [Polyangiaceae bacterium]